MIVFPNAAIAVADWIRSQTPALSIGQPWADKLMVTSRWSDDELVNQPWAVVVRSDGGPDDTPISQSVAIGVTIFGPRDGTDLDDVDTERLSQIVAAIIRDCARTADVNPFAACTDLNGPYSTPSESGRPCYYLTATISVVGQPI